MRDTAARFGVAEQSHPGLPPPPPPTPPSAIADCCPAGFPELPAGPYDESVRVLRVLGVGLAALIVGFGVALSVAFVRAPSGADLQKRVAVMARTHDAALVPLGRVSPFLRQAVVATEDERFYRHRGVDVVAVLRAVPYDLTHLSFAQGASTITEQLAKTVYLGGSDHSPWGKLVDIAVGFRLGHRYSRDVILSAYLSVAYFGEGQYGARQASEFYFGRSERSLGLAQASLLAGLVQGPSLFDPLRNPIGARERQAAVLRAMVRNGYATEGEASAVVAHRLRLRSGVSLPPLQGVSFAVPAPFDAGELAAAVIMLFAAVVVLAALRFLLPPFAGRRPAAAAAFALMGAAALTVAHSVQTF